MVFKLFCTEIHVKSQRFKVFCSLYHPHNCLRCHLKAWRDRGRSREYVIILNPRIKGHEPSHGASCYICVVPVGERPVLRIHLLFKGSCDPVHSHLPHRSYLSYLLHGCIFKFPSEWRILMEPPVPFGIRFYGNDYEAHPRELKVFLHPPALSECSMVVIEDVLTVEHIQHGVPLLTPVIVVRQGYIESSHPDRRHFFYLKSCNMDHGFSPFKKSV